MNPYNKSQTDAVWRRVLYPGSGAVSQAAKQGSGKQAASREMTWQGAVIDRPQDCLPPILLLTRELSCHYEVLARRSPRFRPLYQEIQRQTACLSGLYRVLVGTPAPEAPKLPEPRGQTASLLSRCCRLEGELARLQVEAARESALSPALGELALGTRGRCCTCLEALGRMGK